MSLSMVQKAVWPGAEELVPLSRVVKLLLRRPVHYIVVTAKTAHVEPWYAECQHHHVDPKACALFDELRSPLGVPMGIGDELNQAACDPVLEAVLGTLAPAAPGAWLPDMAQFPHCADANEWKTVTAKRGRRASQGSHDHADLQQKRAAEPREHNHSTQNEIVASLCIQRWHRGHRARHWAHELRAMSRADGDTGSHEEKHVEKHLAHVEKHVEKRVGHVEKHVEKHAKREWADAADDDDGLLDAAICRARDELCQQQLPAERGIVCFQVAGASAAAGSLSIKQRSSQRRRRAAAAAAAAAPVAAFRMVSSSAAPAADSTVDHEQTPGLCSQREFPWLRVAMMAGLPTSAALASAVRGITCVLVASSASAKALPVISPKQSRGNKQRKRPAAAAPANQCCSREGPGVPGTSPEDLALLLVSEVEQADKLSRMEKSNGKMMEDLKIKEDADRRNHVMQNELLVIRQRAHLARIRVMIGDVRLALAQNSISCDASVGPIV